MPPTSHGPSAPEQRAPGLRRLHVVGAALLRAGEVLAARRARHVSAAGTWEFPGGKVEPGEAARSALRRELREEMGLVLRSEQVGERLGRGVDRRPNLEILLDVFVVEVPAADLWTPKSTDHDQLRWLGAAELGTVDWAPADQPVLPELRRLLAARAHQSGA